MACTMETETETDPEFCYGVRRQLVDHDEGHQGSFCTPIFEGVAQYHGTCNIVSALFKYREVYWTYLEGRHRS